MVTAVLREISKARIFKRQACFIGRTSILECEVTLQRPQPRQHVGFLQSDIFRNIASMAAALFLAICGDRIRELRRGVTLDLQGMSIRELAHAGHKY
jgi:hypothetical protein